MSGYEEEHNIPAYATTTHGPRATGPSRPDLSSFFSALNAVSTDEATTNTHTEPLPRDVSALFRLLANNYQIVLGETEGVAAPAQPSDGTTHAANGDIPVSPQQHHQHLEEMIERLMEMAEAPPKQVQGMPDRWFDEELERVPKKNLKQGDTCGLCFVPYLDDNYPLVVRLPCHENHKFDLECVRPWLKVNSTCPFCRTDFAKKKPPPVIAKDEEEDEDEFEGLYA